MCTHRSGSEGHVNGIDIARADVSLQALAKEEVQLLRKRSWSHQCISCGTFLGYGTKRLGLVTLSESRTRGEPARASNRFVEI